MSRVPVRNTVCGGLLSTITTYQLQAIPSPPEFPIDNMSHEHLPESREVASAASWRPRTSTQKTACKPPQGSSQPSTAAKGTALHQNLSGPETRPTAPLRTAPRSEVGRSVAPKRCRRGAAVRQFGHLVVGAAELPVVPPAVPGSGPGDRGAEGGGVGFPKTERERKGN